MTTIDVLKEMLYKRKLLRCDPDECAALTDAIRSLEAVRARAVNPGMTELRDKNDLTQYGVGYLDAMRHVLSILDESEGAK